MIIDFFPSTFFGCDSLKILQIGKHRFKIDKQEKVCDIYNVAVRLLIEKNFEFRSDDRRYMIPLIVQIYMDSRMPEAENYIRDNLNTVLRNLAYDGEYTLAESLLEFSDMADIEKLEELHNYFTKRHDWKMMEIIQDRMNWLIFSREWEQFFESQVRDE